MQPVWGILQAVEGVTGSHPRRLVPPQACAIGVQVPWQCHGPYGAARAVAGAVPRAPGVEPPGLVVAPPSDGSGGAVGRRTLRGRGAGRPTATPLHDPLGHRPAAGPRRPRGPAPQALRKLPGGRCVLALPGLVEDLGAPLACPGLFHLPERVANAPPQRALGQRPCHACRVAAPPSGHPERVWTSGASAVAALAHAPSPRSQGIVSAAATTLPPSKPPPPTGGGTEPGGVAPRVSCASAPRARGTLCGSCTVVPRSAGRPQARQARSQHRAARPKMEARASHGPPTAAGSGLCRPPRGAPSSQACRPRGAG